MNVCFIMSFMLSSILCSCAGTRSLVRLESTPSGAVVSDENQEKLGVTPFELPPEKLDSIAQDKKINLRFQKPGFEAYIISLPAVSLEGHLAKLIPMDPERFKNQILFQYQRELNQMTKDVLTIQAHLVSKKTDLAEKKSAEFTERFPSIAAGFVLRSQVEFLQGKTDLAKQSLLRAQELDPTDEVVSKMMDRYNRQPAEQNP